MSQQLPPSEGWLQYFVSRPPTRRRLCQRMTGTGDSQMSPLLAVLLALIPGHICYLRGYQHIFPNHAACIFSTPELTAL